MSKPFALNIIALSAIVALSVIMYLNFPKPERKGFVYTKRLFEEFHGKKDLEKKLVAFKNDKQQEQDSLSARARRDHQNTQLISAFQLASNNYMLQEEELTLKYTNSIWKQINQYISEYGKENGYDYIFGASGDGNLMFANDANDLTEEIILFINNKYNGE